MLYILPATTLQTWPVLWPRGLLAHEHETAHALESGLLAFTPGTCPKSLSGLLGKSGPRAWVSPRGSRQQARGNHANQKSPCL